ncbi:MAG TPA: transcriptional repressor LexA [Fimbriiglobus sp.]
MSEHPALTAKQQKILDFILHTIQNQGYPPAIRDICTAFDIRSPNGVMCHLRALQKKGYIVRAEKRGEKRAQARGITSPGVTAGGFSLPLLGVVAAGKALEAVAQDDRLEFRDMFGGDNLYVLKVRGQSMVESHIADGDYVVVRKQEQADNGEKVVAMVEKAMTLKKFYKRKDHVRLEPANGTMDPILVDPSKHDVSILGVLVGVIRKC